MASTNFTLRAMFYFLRPSETYFDKLDGVPQVIIKVKKVLNLYFKLFIMIMVIKAGPFFILLIVIENIYAFFKNGKKCVRLNDGIASAGSGVLSRIPE